MNEDLNNQIVEMYTIGKRVSEIKKTINKSEWYIEKILNLNNVPIRRGHFRRFSFNESFFETIDTEAKAYFLGLIIADGYIYKKYNLLEISLKESDKDILIEFCKQMEVFPVDRNLKFYPKYKGQAGEATARVQFHSSKLIKDLEKLNISERKTFLVKCPEIKEDLKPHFWRGIFDGDGTIGFRKCTHCYIVDCGITGNLFVMEDFSKILNILNIKHKITKDKSVFRIRLCSKNAEIFLNYIYKDSNIFLTRKRERFTIYLEKQREAFLKKLKPKQTFIQKGIYLYKNKFQVKSLVSQCGLQKHVGCFSYLHEAIKAQSDYHDKINSQISV